ncbi:MAG: serine hydrolase domain-containing protein [Bryobacteraceae bacterium]
MMRHAWLMALAGISWGASPVDSVFAPYTAPGSPGCAVGVLERGKVALAKGYGLANLDDAIPLTAKSRFYMASVSKQFTSMAALMAEREGRLALNDPLSRHFPEMPAYAAHIPLRRMLDHTAGLRDYLTLWGLKGWSNESVLTEAPTLSLIARQKALDFEPGSAYSYSNSGYFLMALLIERISGQRLDDYLQQRLFRPLGMTATGFQHDHAVPVPNRAQGYRRDKDAWRTAGVGFDVVGSGGLYSNIEDMLRWASHFDDPKADAALLDLLQTPGHLTNGDETPRGYALGLIRDHASGLTRISHAGGATGYRTFFLRFPEKKLSVVTLCNAGNANPEDLSMRVAAAYLPALQPDAKPPAAQSTPRTAPPPGDRQALTGLYYSGELQTVWRIVERGGRLYRQSDGGESEILRDAKGTLTVAGATIVPGKDGFSVSAGRAHDIQFRAAPAE